MPNDVKKEILGVLKKHPEGLTFLDIAKFIGMHRHTVTKYIYELTGEKKIIQRKVGPATLCYLYRENFLKGQLSIAYLPLILIAVVSFGALINLSIYEDISILFAAIPALCVAVPILLSKTGSLGKGQTPVIAGVIILSLLAATALVVQNIDNAVTGFAVGDNSTFEELVETTVETTVDKAVTEPLDETTTTEVTTTVEEIIEETTTIEPINETTIETTTTIELVNETIETTTTISPNETTTTVNITTIPINETTTTTLPINETTTIPINENTTTIEVVNETTTIETTVPTTIETTMPINETTTTISVEPLQVEIIYSERITRGQSIEISALITNPNVFSLIASVDWQLPDGFVIISSQSCEALQAGESCYDNITVQTDLATKLGANSIKAVVNYGA